MSGHYVLFKDALYTNDNDTILIINMSLYPLILQYSTCTYILIVVVVVIIYKSTTD